MLVNNNSNNQNKAVAYVRVSSQKQAEEGVSIAAQIKRIKEYAKFKGITKGSQWVGANASLCIDPLNPLCIGK